VTLFKRIDSLCLKESLVLAPDRRIDCICWKIFLHFLALQHGGKNS